MAGKILIADAVAANRITLKVKLGAACYQVLLAASPDEMMTLVRKEKPQIVVVDSGLLPGGAAAVCDLLCIVQPRPALIVLASVRVSGLPILAEAIRTAIEALPVALPDTGGKGFVRVTASIGLAVGNGCELQGEGALRRLILQADKALFSAKAAGRNRVATHKSDIAA